MTLRALCLVAAISTTATAQNFIYVPADAPNIQSAIGLAVPGDRIIVAPGTYNERLNFNGKDIRIVSSDGPLATTINASGLGGGACVSFVTGETSAAVLAGFRLTGGSGGVPTCQFGSCSAVGSSGGGLLIDGASPRIANCIVTGNYGRNGSNGGQCGSGGDGGHGGGAYIRNAAPLFQNCMFTQNFAGEGGAAGSNGTFCQGGPAGDDGEGGIFYALNATPTFVNCSLAAATGTPFVPGPAGFEMKLEDSDPVIVNCALSGTLSLSGTSNPAISYSMGSGLGSSNGNINGPASFAIGALGECRLSPGSPAIDAGDALAANVTNRDFEFEPRVDGAGIDMGADERFLITTPGSGEDLILLTQVNGFGNPVVTYRRANAGHELFVHLLSPLGGFVGTPPVLAGQLYPTGMPPVGIPPLNLWLDPALAVVFIDGFAGGALGPFNLTAPGLAITFIVPPGLGGTTLRIQGLAVTSSAANGGFALTDGHDIEL